MGKTHLHTIRCKRYCIFSSGGDYFRCAGFTDTHHREHRKEHGGDNHQRSDRANAKRDSVAKGPCTSCLLDSETIGSSRDGTVKQRRR